MSRNNEPTFDDIEIALQVNPADATLWLFEEKVATIADLKEHPERALHVNAGQLLGILEMLLKLAAKGERLPDYLFN